MTDERSDMGLSREELKKVMHDSFAVSEHLFFAIRGRPNPGRGVPVVIRDGHAEYLDGEPVPLQDESPDTRGSGIEVDVSDGATGESTMWAIEIELPFRPGEWSQILGLQVPGTDAPCVRICPATEEEYKL